MSSARATWLRDAAMGLGLGSVAWLLGTSVSVGEARTARPPPRVIGPRYDSDAALPKRAQPVTSYELTARLDAAARGVSGTGTITFVNRSSKPVSELYFHLYLNAFKNSRTLFLRNPHSDRTSLPRDFGYIDVKSVRVREFDNADVWSNRARHSPGDPDDETDIRVPLPEPVAPNQTLHLDVTWDSRLPEVVARTGYSDTFHLVGQWFPKLAQLRDDGTFDHFAFHSHSEFFADYGDYDVTIDTPKSMIVGASGKLVDRSDKGDRRRARYVLKNAHDFAWTAWDDFQRAAETIDGIDVVLLYPKAHETNRARTFDALRKALPRFNRLYGRYPYPTLTVVHPPRHARDAGGMEYPGLITTGGPWWSTYVARIVEGVTVHELGHQWFYGLVGTAEHRSPFLDEGLNSYAEGDAMSAAYGPTSGVTLPFLPIAGRSIRRASAASYAHDHAVSLPAAAFPNWRAIGSLVYGRTATVMHTLERVYGRDRVARFLGRYMRRYRYQHPGEREFFAAMDEVMGQDVVRNAKLALTEKGWVDYRVRSLSSRRMTEPQGVFETDAGRVVEKPESKSSRYTTRALIVRNGNLKFPVDIELRLRDGRTVRKRWEGKSDSFVLDHEGDEPATAVIVDPAYRVRLDQNLLNNAKSSKASRARAQERVVYFSQVALGWLGP